MDGCQDTNHGGHSLNLRIQINADGADRLLSEGRMTGEVCQQLEVAEATLHRWRNQYGGMKANDMKLFEATFEAISLSEKGVCLG